MTAQFPQYIAAAQARPHANARRSWDRFATVCAVSSVIFLGTAFSAFAAESSGDSHGLTARAAWAFLGVLASTGAGTVMVWRARYSWTIMWWVGVAALVLPLDPLGTLLAMGWVIPSTTRRRAVLAAAWGALVTVVALGRDFLRHPPHVLFSMKDYDTGVESRLPLLGYVVVAIMMWGIGAALGLVRRYRADSVRSQTRAAETEQVAVRLRSQLERQEERDLIAREMHDTIAHELSVISLHASALEVVTQDEAAKTSARAVRRLANRGLGELRSLIGSLRDSTVDGYVGPPRSAEALARIVDEARAAGVRVQDHIDIRSGDSLASIASSAIYRIVQESMTNAVRHSSSSPVTVTVTGSPYDGITVIVASWLEEQVNASVGAGSGIIGMQERARALGGELRAGVEHDMWVVRARLPWCPAEDGNGASS
ncbi:hypothetical protein GCM10010401_06720 [Rarobacter faecitabidus]|uniref:histidine kinase n=1 Tax=Rarobacter faecitabidus TaxID=13243 RepID=A0A542ZTP2_RARFA|nr:histidine kinase [Rarobacter faecitabidus]TQL63580.1 signal transduction histidine kinase [Rarobacter faecitabidus]